MPKGFIYVVMTLQNDYTQRDFRNVPTDWEGRLYFGPCKRSMRPKMEPDDYVFGISPSNLGLRRIVFAARIEEKLTFREAYTRFPDLRGPEGPIHVKPVNRPELSFPEDRYEHINGAMHCTDWRQDLGTPDQDAFFTCYPREGWLGRWLATSGPKVNEEILGFLKTCSVHNQTGRLSDCNRDATVLHPIAYRRLYRGLHLETSSPHGLLELCATWMAAHPLSLTQVPRTLRRSQGRRSCS